MKKIYTLAAVLVLALLCGCSKEKNEDLIVPNHDFTVQEWADFERGDKGNTDDAEKDDPDDPDSEDTSAVDQTGDAETIDKTPAENDDKDTSSFTGTAVVVIDPGHGGQFDGAASGKLVEKELTLKVSKYIKEYLESNYSNVEVYLTRETDTEFSSSLKDDLEDRARFAKKKDADVLVSIHFNASDEHKLSGANIFVSRRKEVSKACSDLARCIMDELVDLGIEEKSIAQRKSNDMFDENGDAYDYYAINRHCAARNIPGIIVESCYIDNDNDRGFIDSEAALQKLGIANAVGIAHYFGLKEKQ